MASIFRTFAHESPVYFYSILLGSLGPVVVLTVPPIRRRLGYTPAEPIPTTYPLPKRERRPVSTDFDDAPTPTGALPIPRMRTNHPADLLPPTKNKDASS
ncbi:hypothetical protein CPB86DRAFT_385777 [Serendipita vermifera]|nr:hypothetical protein CPB86DRAFT_385777 [Serendipita vermifera]